MTSKKNAPEVAGGNTNPGPKKPEKKYRNWQLTSYTKEKAPVWIEDKMEYLCYGEEYTKSGRFHWQGFVCFKSNKTMPSAQKYIGNPVAHMEPIRGTIGDNERYCSKDGKYHEFGKRPKQGERTDIKKIMVQILDEGMDPDDLLRENPSMYRLYNKAVFIPAIEKSMMNKMRMEKTEAIWIWGDTGTGKSHRAFTEAFEDLKKGISLYIHPKDGRWWDNYRQQNTVIINEFRKEYIEYSFLLELCDKWPFSVPRRGTAPMPFISKKLIITTDDSPRMAFPELPKRKLDELLRRIEIIHLTEKYEE